MKSILAYCPVHRLADALHVVAVSKGFRVHKKHLRYPIGVIFMLTGSGVAVVSGEWVLPHMAHILVDMVAYGVHGAGAVPFVNVVIRRLKMEDDE